MQGRDYEDAQNDADKYVRDLAQWEGRDTVVTFASLRQANQRRLPQFKNANGEPAHSEPDGSDWSDAEWLQAVTGEIGEFANVAKKLRRGDFTREQALPMMRDELADTVCYLDLLAFRLGIDLGEAVRDKFNRVSERVGSDVKL